MLTCSLDTQRVRVGVGVGGRTEVTHTPPHGAYLFGDDRDLGSCFCHIWRRLKALR